MDLTYAESRTIWEWTNWFHDWGRWFHDYEHFLLIIGLVVFGLMLLNSFDDWASQRRKRD